MKARTSKNLTFTGRSSFVDTLDDSVRPLLPASLVLAGLRSELDLVLQGNHLIEQARTAFMLREYSALDAVTTAILELPLPSSLRCMANYYQVCRSSATAQDEERGVLAKIADQAAPGHRERVMLQYARTFLNSGDAESAAYCYLEVAHQSRRTDLLTHLQSLRLIAICRSMNGDHRGALKDLMRLWGSMQNLRHTYPVEFLTYLNSLAVELSQLGRVEEARSLLAIPLASSLAPHFPTWHDTRRELDEIEAQGAKSPPLFFAIGSVFEPASQLEGESRANVSIGTVPAPVPETARAQEAVPLAQPRPARSRAIATSYKREAIQLAAIPLVVSFRPAPLLPAGTSEKCSTPRCRPAVMRALHRYITGKPSRAPPARVLFL